MIKCAAIRIGKDVYTGRRHNNIIEELVKKKGMKSPIYGEQGFVDDKGKFFNRLEAAKHALECGQIKKLKWPPKLYSEDLY